VRSGRRLLIFRAANGGAAAAERTERREMELGFALAFDDEAGLEFFIYLFCHNFQKINGRIKIFEKCTSGVVPHRGVRRLVN
jgi:hypothetical protein